MHPIWEEYTQRKKEGIKRDLSSLDSAVEDLDSLDSKQQVLKAPESDKKNKRKNTKLPKNCRLWGL